MTVSTVHVDNEVKQWSAKFFEEYVRFNEFGPYMGANSNAVIHVNEELGQKPGKSVTISLIARLKGAGKKGNALLEGNEDVLANYGFEVIVENRRNAFMVTNWEEQKTVLDLLAAGRPQLMNWVLNETRRATERVRPWGIVDAFSMVEKGVPYDQANDAQKDAWNVANGGASFAANPATRILYGDQLANYNADHSAALANVTDQMTLNRATVRLLKRLARGTDPQIRPTQVKTATFEEWYVLFAHPDAFRDLKTDMEGVPQNPDVLAMAGVRGNENPIFRSGDLIYDGVVIREAPDIDASDLATAGAASAPLAPCYMCGAQAVGIGYAKRAMGTTNVSDYGFRHGAGIEEVLGIEKLLYNSLDHGIATVFVGAAPDA